MSDKSNLFQSGDIAEYYLKYRPTYGRDVFDTIVGFCKETSSADFSLAIDVGCGSGQSSLPLTSYFQKVIGVDVSEPQISKAPTHIPNLSFRVGTAEDLSFAADGSAGLVTAAQAMHWTNTERFYSEVQRVLRPGGAFVAYGYGMPALDEPKANEAIDYLYTDILGPYWSDGRNQVEQHYHSFTLPFPGWRRKDSLKIERQWALDELIGYLCSWSAYQTYLREHPLDGTMAGLRHRLQELYQAGGGLGSQRDLHVSWPVFMLLGHKPLD
ncbi:hypothetical protein ACOMHN_023065 [Nucella lapillus]